MMSKRMLLCLLTASLPVSVLAQQGDALEQLCAHDRAALLAMDETAFDQTVDSGWRVLAKIENCYSVVADLIRDFRQMHNPASTTLAWHEGQIRAYMGNNVQAVALFNQARHANNLTGWNSYVDASIAFLQRDHNALLTARGELLTVPKPDVTWTDNNGNPIDVDWPPNKQVVERLIRCFDRSYAYAYGRCEISP